MAVPKRKVSVSRRLIKNNSKSLCFVSQYQIVGNNLSKIIGQKFINKLKKNDILNKKKYHFSTFDRKYYFFLKNSRSKFFI